MAAPDAGIFGPNVDEEINRTWKEVEDRVLQMAGGDRSKIKQLGIDNVLQYLDQAQSKDKKEAEKYGAVRNIFNRTLQCIQTVGGIVADGASYAFAPAGTCYNALTFVIQAWQGYEGIFESLASLLEKCTEFLDRLSYYAASGMDSKLTKVACQHLHIFVEICDRSLRLKLKRNKFAAFMKQMFLNDDGVQDLLGAMQNLVDKERGLVSAQTWKSSNEAASNSRDGLSLTRKVHSTLVEDKNQLKREKELQKWKLSIIKALEFEAKILDEGTPEPWEKMWKKHKSKILEGSGEWLVQDPRFKAWATTNDASSQILGLEGEDGAGKTLLASNVILHLRKMKTVGVSGSRVVVAHNFVEPDSKSAAETDTPVVISRNLMCQLALGDEPFMKSVATICEKSQYFDSPLDMWTQLLLQNEDMANIDVTFFIVLDGLGSNVETFTHLLRSFSDNALIQRTRILLTGKRDMFDSIENAGGLKVEKIALGEPNKQDVELYINNRMGEMEILKDTTRPGVSEMREKILNDLQESTGGDYYKIGHVLDNISKTDDVEEINTYLQGAGDARLDQIEDDIEKLNKTRTEKEISEINEIILWVWASPVWMTPLEMEGILALKAGNGGGTSLMSMVSKIKTKYTIFNTDYNVVDFRVSEILDKIPMKKKDTSDEASSSGFKEIQPSEINIIKFYLSTVCPPDLYTKFGFDEFFNLKMVRKGSYIYQDPDNGHITIVLRCLTCLEEERNEKTEPLRTHAMNHLLYHLEKTDLSLADRSLKAEVGIKLVRLFTEKFALDSLFEFRTDDLQTHDIDFSRHEIPVTWNPWIDTDEGTNVLSKWFKDSAVIEKVKDSPLIIAFNAPDADQHKALFEPASKLVAENLFRIDITKKETYHSFVFLYSLLTKKDRKDPIELDKIYEPTVEMFEMVENWSQELLGVTEKDSMWEAKAAALLDYLPRDNIPAALAEERVRKAMELDPDSWRASYTLSRVIESKEEAITLLASVVGRLLEDTEWRDDKQHKGILAKMVLELGDRYWENDETQDEAMKVYAKIMDIDQSYSIIESFSQVLAKYSSKQKWDAVCDFLEGLLEQTEDGKNMAGIFIRNGIINNLPIFRPLLGGLVRSGNRWDLVETLLTKANEIDHGTDRRETFTFLFNQGNALVEIEGHENAGIAAWEAIPTCVEEDSKDWATGYTTPYLFNVWIKLATAEGTTTSQAEAYYNKIEAWYEKIGKLENQFTDNALAFAQYLRLRGDEVRAKEVLRKFARESLEMLYDDVVENDMMSFWNLSQIFSTMRDNTNNVVAWEMMMQVRKLQFAEYERKLEIWKQGQKGSTKEDTSNETDKNDESGEGVKDETTEQKTGDSNTADSGDVALANMEEEKATEETAAGENEEAKPAEDEPEPEKPDLDIAFCDGRCDKVFSSPHGFWTCLTESGKTHLCDDCYEKLHKGELGPDVCGKNHERFYFERDDEKMAAIPTGSVLVGDRVITLEEWKEEIKAKYVEFSEDK
ncbi:hypothetical protein G7Z17_g4331 [Cylindrodendrum hubeiense]|uniref:Fungal STAND N-terminal Goodbye domain-containing protein n=1 Tax=Cylindrodendrum hubeiense TaxID=595255 RepID=A0A9P5LIZ8_9HYPO|nr:hypothetical protein G7Z17_g4331 [Cylindrodendrum hubeiense]